VPYKNKDDQAAAAARHYAKNRRKMIARAKVANAALRVAQRELIAEFLTGKKCADCPENDPACLDFDHRDPSAKCFSIGSIAQQRISLSRVRAEIAKCDIRCSNCHRKRHARERS
jgi:hypothetical protein